MLHRLIVPSNPKVKTGKWSVRTIAGSSAGIVGAMAEGNRNGPQNQAQNGWKDGPAEHSRFDYPVSIAVVWLRRGSGGQKQTCQCFAICDRGNKSIRLLYPGYSTGTSPGSGKWFVQTIVGKGKQVKSDKDKGPQVTLGNITGVRGYLFQS